MDACLYIGCRNNEWVRKLFPGMSPGELTIAGKNWVRYSLDLCSMLDIGDCHIADCFFHDELRHRLGDGAFWLTKIHFLPVSDALTPEELLTRHRDTLPQDDLLIFWGQVLPDLPDIKRLFDDLREVKPAPGEALEDGIYLLRDGILRRCACPLLRMDSLQSYFRLNFRMLKDPGMYDLPGYDPENNRVYIGENVVMMQNCRITPPAVIRANTCLGRSVQMKGDVIIGNSSLIESCSTLKHAIIMDYTCIGRNVSIENKIVSGNRIIDAVTAEYVDLDDNVLAKSAAPRHFDRYSIFEFLFALNIAIFMAPLYTAAAAFRKWTGKLPFFNLLLRVYPRCWQVLSGGAQLVRIGISDRAFAFRLADMYLLLRDPHQREVADIYYLNHKSVRLMLTVVILGFLKRLFVFSLPEAEGRKK